MSASQPPVGSGWALLQRGLAIHEKEHADVQQKLRQCQEELQRTHQKAETVKTLNDELRQRNKSLGDDCEKFAQAVASLKEQKGELEAAHEQLNQAFRVKKEKLVDANAALATSYKDVEELRRKLVVAEANIGAYKELSVKMQTIGQEASQTDVVKQEPAALGAVGGTVRINQDESTWGQPAGELSAVEPDAAQPRDDEDGTQVRTELCGRHSKNAQHVPMARLGGAYINPGKTSASSSVTSTTITSTLRDSGTSETNMPPKKRGRPAKGAPSALSY